MDKGVFGPAKSKAQVKLLFNFKHNVSNPNRLFPNKSKKTL